MAKNWVSGAIKRPGQLHRDLGVPQGQKIPPAKLAAAAKRSGKVGDRARLAQTMKGFKHSAHPSEKAYLHQIPSRSGH